MQAAAWTGAVAHLVECPLLHAMRAPGTTCIQSLRDLAEGMHGELNDSKGCGALMRVSPVAWLAATQPQSWRHQAAITSATLTHHHPLAASTSAVMSELCWQMLYKEQNLSDALTKALELTECDHALSELLVSAIEEGRDWQPDPVNDHLPWGDGWVTEETLASALAIAANAKQRPLSKSLALAANHGGDSDSVASVTGHILGLQQLPDAALIIFTLKLAEFAPIADAAAMAAQIMATEHSQRAERQCHV